MPEQLRTAYGKRFLKKAILRPKKIDTLSFDAIRKCVIVIDEAALNVGKVHDTVKVLEAANPAMNIHFVSYAKKPNDKTTLPIEQLEMMYRNDLNWYFRPKQMSIGVCDLLIDLTTAPVLPLQLLTALSNATLKVGVDQPWNREVLNLMIQSKAPVEIDRITEQLVKYINMIKKGKNAA